MIDNNASLTFPHHFNPFFAIASHSHIKSMLTPMLLIFQNLTRRGMELTANSDSAVACQESFNELRSHCYTHLYTCYFHRKKKRSHHQLCVWTVEWMSPADNWTLHSGDFSNIQTIVRTIRVESQHTSSTINALTKWLCYCTIEFVNITCGLVEAVKQAIETSLSACDHWMLISVELKLERFAHLHENWNN